jgi:hypothetical protein
MLSVFMCEQRFIFFLIWDICNGVKQPWKTRTETFHLATKNYIFTVLGQEFLIQRPQKPKIMRKN